MSYKETKRKAKMLIRRCWPSPKGYKTKKRRRRMPVKAFQGLFYQRENR
jgi:hypothetical protein